MTFKCLISLVMAGVWVALLGHCLIDQAFAHWDFEGATPVHHHSSPGHAASGDSDCCNDAQHPGSDEHGTSVDCCSLSAVPFRSSSAIKAKQLLTLIVVPSITAVIAFNLAPVETESTDTAPDDPPRLVSDSALLLSSLLAPNAPPLA